MTRLFAIFSILFLITSIFKTYRISKSDLKWQPYKVGDVLVFESSEGRKETIEIKDIDKRTNPLDPLTLYPRSQSVFVETILKLKAWESGTYIDLKIHFRESKFLYHGSTNLKIEEFEKYFEPSKEDARIEDFDLRTNLDREDVILKSIYWSKKFGYLEIEYKDNYSWKLISFKRKGKEIFKVVD
jgi:hypothetical protein